MTRAPDAPLSVVVIPARDEEATIGDCLAALAVQTIAPTQFEVILVADGCVDRTVEFATAGAARLGLRLTVLQGPGAGTGPARRLGMEAAAERLEAAGAHRGLIATTDADSVPSREWLAHQLAHLANGAEVIAGRIELDHESSAGLPAGVLRRREHDARRRMREVARIDPDAGHHHFAGASLGVSVEAYRRVGGLAMTPALEDEAFAEQVRANGIPILRAADVRVQTAARTDGRARRGLSVDLAVSAWRERRRFVAADFDLRSLTARWAAAGSPAITVIVPAKECAATVGSVLETTVRPVREAGLIDDVVVVDAASGDGTAAIAEASGARVLQQDELCPDLGPAHGKGDAMWRALQVTAGEIVCFLDADTSDPDPGHLLGLIGPLLQAPELMLVKGAFDRPFRTGTVTLAGEGGRVTELMARPLLNLHFPLLAGFVQPLAGEFAGRRHLLEELPFPVGYGVEIALLIDSLERCGLDALAESHLGTRQNRHQPLRSLGEMAFAVLAAVEQRLDGPRSVTGGQFLRPWEDGAVVRVSVLERPPARTRASGRVAQGISA
ncbi:glucosyl-3-phosphoglycerate synthase [Conexibacter sp. DBS9H8]|uniref:glucosyl-3-phosphoglycerate synthase n=1 Tax=Conexibacter sp. DBS9H8 TaxID=2937801 RepID=UPI00200BBB56|nr:glucosyl-3-phosphoglycerate synthase [Conexibacter sp. DBS9H8]